MKKISVIVLSLFVCSFMLYVASNTYAKDDEATAKTLVAMVKGAHNHPKYYTGKHGFLNDAALAGGFDKGMYIMSWLVLDPSLKLGSGGGAAAMAKDLYKDYFGIPKVDVSAKASNYPHAGDKSAKQNSAKEDMYWIPINLQDLFDAGQGKIFDSGNEFDWTEWGGQGVDQSDEFMFCLVKWNKAGTITIKVGSDDSEMTWVNGKEVCKGVADRDWTKDQDSGKFDVKADEWNALFVEVGENGGEWGFSVRLEPVPDDHTLNTGALTAVNLQSKLSATWGNIKVQY